MAEDVVESTTEDIEETIARKKLELKLLKKKRKRYSAQDFLNDIKSEEPNNVKATTKAIIGGCKIFVKESPHPMVGFLRDTAREIFS